jgi:hypothetical protein
MNHIELFKTFGYCFVKSVLSKEIQDFVTQYTLFDEMQNYSPGDEQSPNAHSKYADPAMETLLLNLQPIIEKHTDLSLFPTYSYFRVYRNGDELEEHIDRPSCEISATVCFNYNYELFEWPIYMKQNKIIQHPGDMIIYRGCDLEHKRDKFFSGNEEHWHVQGFFHYVDVNGPFKEYKFDKRESIGTSKVQTRPTKRYITFTK